MNLVSRPRWILFPALGDEEMIVMMFDKTSYHGKYPTDESNEDTDS
jgi:hypothetical protein